MKQLPLLIFGLLITKLSFASFSYECRLQGADESIERFYLFLDHNKGTVSTEDATDKIVRDLDYRPRGDKNSQRFYGKPALTIFADGIDGFGAELILNGYLVSGAPVGYARVRARGEGFFDHDYKCVRQ